MSWRSVTTDGLSEPHRELASLELSQEIMSRKFNCPIALYEVIVDIYMLIV